MLPGDGSGAGSYFWGPGSCDVPAFPRTCLQVDGSEAVTVLGLFCRKGHGRSVCVYYVRRDLGAAGEGRFWPLCLALMGTALISARPREGAPAPGAPQRPTLAADDLRPERLHHPEPNRSACVSVKPLPQPITADAFRLHLPQKVSCAGNVTQSWVFKS